MAIKDTNSFSGGMSRRDFLKTTAVAGAAVGCGLSVAIDPQKAAAYENDTVNYKVTSTTCPYCSASCGQRVVVALTGASAGKVVDIYGDFESPMNSGGLCAKGAGAKQLVNNSRRIGAYPGAHPETVYGASSAFGHDSSYTDGIAYKRTGDGNWSKMNLDTAMAEIAAESGRGSRCAELGHLQPEERRIPRLVAHEQRVELHLPQDHRELRYEQRRASGPYLTQLHGGRSGRRIRTWRYDEPLGRHRQLDERRHLGCQPG